MTELRPESAVEVAKPFPAERQEQGPTQNGGLKRKLSSVTDTENPPLQGLTALSEAHPPLPSLEQSPDSEEQGQVREWQDGYKPAKRQRKKQRPGETIFRVPMSMEQRKSLGASVRPKEVQATESPNGQITNAEEVALGETPLSCITRGGTKLKFRAYGPYIGAANTQSNDGSHLSPVSPLAMQEPASPGPQTWLQYLDPDSQPNTRDAEFLSAPLDNGPKLAWWLAQRISHTNSWQTSNNTTSRFPELTVSQFYGQSDSPLDRRRQIERQRKAKWREANAERNRETDLRARVKRQARVRFGDAESPEINNWIAAEVARRRARREYKQISQAAKSGNYPIFSDSDIIRRTLLREDRGFDLKPAVKEIKKLIADVLFPASIEADVSHRLHAIELLSKTVNLQRPQNDDSFQAALTSIAQDENVLYAARSLMEQFRDEDDEDTSLDGPVSAPTQSNDSISNLPQTVTPPGQILPALDEALAILSELNELGNEQQASCAPNSALDAATKQNQRRQALQDLGVSESRLDDFLVLANGGPLESDPDDDLAAELYGEQLFFNILTIPSQQISSHVSGTANWDIVNSVLTALLQRCIPPPKRGRRTNQVVAREARARKQAKRMKTLLDEIEIGGNRVRSRIESQAISEFYSRVISFNKTCSFEMSRKQALTQHQQSSATGDSRPSIAPVSGTKRKLKHMEDAGDHTELSSSISMALPSATNPFADDQKAVTSATSGTTPASVATTGLVSTAVLEMQSPQKIQYMLPLPAPVEPRVQLHIGYPQFHSTHSSGAFRS